MLDDLKKDVKAGEPINELKLVYLPLFRSIKLSPTELFRESARLIKDIKLEDEHRQKIYALSIVLGGKIVDEAAIRAVKEEIMYEDNVIIKIFEEVGEKRGLAIGITKQQEETAKKMLLKGFKFSEIIEFTGIDVDHLTELQESIKTEAV